MSAPIGNKFGEGHGPIKYRTEYDNQAYKLCLLGFIDSDLANYFEVEEQTINNWKKKYISFAHSIKKGKAFADAEVAASLRQRAIGFTKSNIEKIFQFRGQIIRAQTSEYFPPDAGAAINWLKNRQRTLWAEKYPFNIELEKLSDSELDRIIERLKNNP